MASIRASRSERVRDASDAGGANDYYSSLSRNRNILQEYRLTAQYNWAQGRYVSVGARVSGLLDETFSRSFGVSETTGKNEWHWFVAPNVRFRYNKDSDQVDVSASGYARQPGAQLRLPVLNIADPSRLTLGNIYLKPYGNIRNHTVTANYEEDSYRLVLGRYILFGVKWNFGKMNAAHSQRAQQAAWNMAW